MGKCPRSSNNSHRGYSIPSYFNTVKITVVLRNKHNLIRQNLGHGVMVSPGTNYHSDFRVFLRQFSQVVSVYHVYKTFLPFKLKVVSLSHHWLNINSEVVFISTHGIK